MSRFYPNRRAFEIDRRDAVRLLLVIAFAAILSLASPASAIAFTITPATITSPVNGSVLPGSLVTFQWTPGGGVSDYLLCVSSVAAGQCEIYNVIQNTLHQGPSYSHSLAGLPTDGRTIYVRLSSQDPATTEWYSVDYTYVAAGGSFVPATIGSPAPGSDLASSNATFQWTAGTGVSDYWLYISNTHPGGSELYNADQGTSLSRAVSGLPTDGNPLYVRLASRNAASGNWFYVDYRYVASGPFVAAVMVNPPSGATFNSSTAIFQWTPGALVSDYWLNVSSTAPGNGELYSADQGTGLSRTVTGLPVNGGAIYVRLASKNAGTGAWTSQDYVYTAFTSTGNAVTFLGIDWQTEGDWNGVYGQDGNVIAESSTSTPTYSAWNPMSTTNLGFYFDFSTDSRGPVQPKYNYDPAARVIAHFYNRSYMEFQVNTTDRQSHRLALYFSDWQPAQPLEAFLPKRSITLRVFDTDSGGILDTRILSDYTAGVYLVYTYVGNITFHIANNYPPVDTDGVTRDLPNGTVTGFFWGGQGLPQQNGAQPSLRVASTHTGNFMQGRTGTYSVSVSNAASAGPTIKAVTVTESVPSAFTLVSMAGTGWTCSASTCTRTDPLAAGASYPPIAVTVNVPMDATSPQVNSVFVSGGASPAASGSDTVIVDPNPPVLSIAKSHTGNFLQGQIGATYTVTVSNSPGVGPTNTTVTVTETVPSGMTLTSMAGTGWTCPSGGTTCTRNDALSGGSSYPPITVTVDVSPSPPATATNQVSVAGGGSASSTASDPTVINPAAGGTPGVNPRLYLQNQSNNGVSVWIMGGTNGATIQSSPWFATAAPNWKLCASADMNHDGIIDLIFQNTVTNDVSIWFMTGADGTTIGTAPIVFRAAPDWHVKAAADMNGDGEPDLILQNDVTNGVSIWFMNSGGLSFSSAPQIWVAASGWKVVGTGDINNDGTPDLVLQHQTTNQLSVWFMNAGGMSFSSAPVVASPASGWLFVGTDDFNGDGTPDYIFQNRSSGGVSVWYMTGTQGTTSSSSPVIATAASGWFLLTAH